MTSNLEELIEDESSVSGFFSVLKFKFVEIKDILSDLWTFYISNDDIKSKNYEKHERAVKFKKELFKREKEAVYFKGEKSTSNREYLKIDELKGFKDRGYWVRVGLLVKNKVYEVYVNSADEDVYVRANHKFVRLNDEEGEVFKKPGKPEIIYKGVKLREGICIGSKALSIYGKSGRELNDEVKAALFGGSNLKEEPPKTEIKEEDKKIL